MLQRYYERHLTPTGKALLLLQMVSLSLGLVGSEVLVYMFLCAMLALWITAIVVGSWYRPRQWSLIAFEQTRLCVHQPAVLSLVLKNTGRRLIKVQTEAYLRPELARGSRLLSSRQHDHAALRLRSENIEQSLPRDGVARFRYLWTPTRRGKYRLRSLSLISLFPLEIMRWRKVRAVEQVLWVYPEITAKPAPSSAHTSQGQQTSRRSQRQYTEHLAGIRPWKEGDSPRLIHWASFARTGQLAVKEFEQQQQERVGLWLHAEYGSDSEDFEDALSVLAGYLDTEGHDRLAFLQLNDRSHVSQNLQHYWQMLAEAQLPLRPTTVTADASKHWPQVSQVILIALQLPPDYETLSRHLERHGIRLSLYMPPARALPEAIPLPPRKHRR